MEKLKSKHNKKLVPYARELRKDMTKEERKLWYEFLRGYPVKFLRQKVIGRYISDFYCAKAQLVVELDGSQHYEQQVESDNVRTEFFNSLGIEVVRFSNLDVLRDFEGVCESIDLRVKSRVDNL